MNVEDLRGLLYRAWKIDPWYFMGETESNFYNLSYPRLVECFQAVDKASPHNLASVGEDVRVQCSTGLVSWVTQSGDHGRAHAARLNSSIKNGDPSGALNALKMALDRFYLVPSVRNADSVRVAGSLVIGAGKDRVATISKMLHWMRPTLIPIVDSRVCNGVVKLGGPQEMGKPKDIFAPLSVAIQCKALQSWAVERCNSIREQSGRRYPRPGEERFPSAIRIIECVLFRHGRDS